MILEAFSDQRHVKTYSPEAGFLAWIDMHNYCYKHKIDNPAIFWKSMAQDYQMEQTLEQKGLFD